MTEEIYTLAAGLSAPSEEEAALLRLLCQGAEKSLARQVGAGREECREALLCAAAFLAAGALLDSRAGAAAGVERFTVGDVSVTTGGSAGGDRLRQLAAGLMAPYRTGEGFAFRGVRG